MGEGPGVQMQPVEGPGVQMQPDEYSYVVLAAERTQRKDPLNGFKRYTGGWNISDRHYWSVSSLKNTLHCVPLPFLIQLNRTKF